MIVVSAKDLTKAYGTDVISIKETESGSLVSTGQGNLRCLRCLLEKCPVNPEIISFLQTRKSVI